MSRETKKAFSIYWHKARKNKLFRCRSATNVSLIITLKYCLSKFGSHGCGLFGFAIFCICLIPTKSIMVCLWPPDRKFDTVSGELITFHTRHIACHFFFTLFSRIGHFHDDVILLLRPESFRALLSCANKGICYSNLAGITTFEYGRINEKDSGRSSKMTPSWSANRLDWADFYLGLQLK